jgi:hypothetical protein
MMRKGLVALALLLSATATADAGNLKYKAKVTAYTAEGEAVDEQVIECPNINSDLVKTCQFRFEIPYEDEPWGISVRINEPWPGILNAKALGQARPKNSWTQPVGRDELTKESGSTVEFEAQWRDKRIQGTRAEQYVTVARFKVEVL